MLARALLNPANLFTLLLSVGPCVSFVTTSLVVDLSADSPQRQPPAVHHRPSPAMARHFSVNKKTSSSVRGWQNFTELDWLHFFGRLLVCLYFLHALLYNLSHIDDVTKSLTDAGWLPADLVLPVIIASVAVAFIGSALFFTASDPPSFYLLLAFLVPQIIHEHILPLLYSSLSSASFHAHVVGALQSLGVLGAILVIYTYTEHIAWLESEQKAEIRRALEDFYRKKEREGKGGEVATAEHKREPKKVK